MPLNINDMDARRTSKDEAVDQLNEDMVEEVYAKDFKPRKLYAQTLSRMKEVKDVFDQVPPTQSLVPATEFESMFQDSIWSWSPKKISNIKTIMGITSIRKDGKWWWTRPRDPRGDNYQAGKKAEMQRSAIKKLNRKLYKVARPAAIKLLAIMKEHGYDAHPDTVLHQMRNYSRGTIIRCKASLGIVSWKDKEIDGGDGNWHWLYFAPEFTEWFHKELSDPSWVSGKVPREYIHEKGWREHKWSALLFKTSERKTVQRGIGVMPDGTEYTYYRLR